MNTTRPTSDEPANSSPHSSYSQFHRPRRHYIRVLAEGRQESVVLVPLAGGGTATVDGEDFDKLLSLGFSTQWIHNDNGFGTSYVRVAHATARGGYITVARLILEPSAGRTVKYRDGDRTNLRRANLYVQQGYARDTARAALASRRG